MNRSLSRVAATCLGLGTLILVSLPSPALASAGVNRQLERDHANGRISEGTFLVEVFRSAFAPDRVDRRYAALDVETSAHYKCLTPFIVRFRDAKDEMSAAAVAEIEGYLAPSASRAAAATYISPSGLFEFTYETTGPNAVNATDVDPANGIPDLVERHATYSDFVWQEQITNLGFVGPLLPGDGSYDMSYQALGAGFYGFTQSVGAGLTIIVLNNNFGGAGFGPNTDPDGPVEGRAKVTIAHEFKHASQFTTSGWSEGFWQELDATWIEDVVYNDTNDYLNFTGNGSFSQLDRPDLALDSPTSIGGYEDCLWETYLSETYGNQIIVDFWADRDANPAQQVKGSYQDAMGLYGTSWQESFPKFFEWCWFTGSRAEPPFGFGDASILKRMDLLATVSTYPYSVSAAADQLSSDPRRFNPPGSPIGFPRIIFDGQDDHDQFVISVIAEEPDGSFTIVQPPVDALADADYTVPLPWTSLLYVGVMVTNVKRTEGDKTYTLQVVDEAGTNDITTIPGALDRLELRTASPNPFRTTTRIDFSLPQASRTTVKIYDVLGRQVRTLLDGDQSAGPGGIAWDGLDDAGRHVPAGVYWSRIETKQGSVAKRVTVLR